MLPKERIITGPGLSEFDSLATLYHSSPMEQFGLPRFLGSPLAPLPCSRDPGRVAFATVTWLSDVAPADQTTKAATISISRLIHTASVPAVYASRFGFPYTGKTRFRWVTALTGWDLNPLDSVSKFQRGLSPPIPMLQASPGATDVRLPWHGVVARRRRPASGLQPPSPFNQQRVRA
jgi:hypothetical protein